MIVEMTVNVLITQLPLLSEWVSRRGTLNYDNDGYLHVIKVKLDLEKALEFLKLLKDGSFNEKPKTLDQRIENLEKKLGV